MDRDGQTRGQARERPKGGDGPRATRATGVSKCLHTPVQLRASCVGTLLSRIAQVFPLRVLNLPRDLPRLCATTPWARAQLLCVGCSFVAS